MFKRNLLKLSLSCAIILWAVFSLMPLKDREFPDFAKDKARAKTAEFAALLKEAGDRRAAGRAPSAYIGLSQIAKERKIDLAQYFPQLDLGDVKNIDKRNAILLEHLLKESKGKLQLGLDLKGGVGFTLEVDEKAAGAVADQGARKEKLTKAIEIIGTRINGLGVAEPLIRPVGENRIEVQLPGVNTKDNPEVLDSVKKPARLDFRLVHPNLTPGSVPPGEIPPGYEIMALDHEGRGGESMAEEIFVKRIPEMSGDVISDAFANHDQYGKAEIILRFTKEGRRRFAEATRVIAGYSQQLQQQTGNSGARARLAIVLDGKLYSAPGVEKEIDSDTAQITGNFTDREAQELANVLNNPLDLPLQVKEQYEVGPSLAQDAISSGIRASVIGTVLVVAFMVTFYSVGGLVAVGTLAFNVLIIFASMAMIGATMTLPGLAGIVLTIGMAVDANILIFERMREELAAGKSLASANQSGYMKALTTILDAHLVQLIICGIMIWLGTGPIRGFGVTLLIGVLSTLFSVLVTAHMVLEMMIEAQWLKRFTMRRMLKDLHIDFVKFGKPAFIGSWLVVLLGVAVVIMKGDRIYGIDFAGGDQITIEYKQRPEMSTVRNVAGSVGIHEVNPTFVNLIGTDRQVLKVETPEGRSGAFLEALQKALPNAGLQKVGENHIGASIGKEIELNALLAVAVSMLTILIYIAFRFEFGFGIGAMFSSLHDILMTIGIFVLFGHQFSAPMVAAILCIAGYSINETVVVFDRIREELKERPNGSLRDIVNSAINKVFARTIMTSTTTFLAALSLFIFGGGVMRDISFTFLVGIVTSTFSAVFIAAQVFYWWHKGDRKHVEKHQDVKPTYEWTGASKASQ